MLKYVIIAVIVLAVLLVIWYVTTHNTFVTLQNQISEAFSTMDIYLNKRSDMIPNLVSTVKGYAKYESETLEKVVNARNKALSASTSTDKLAAEGEISNAISKLLALTENYPDLKANTNFLDLQQTLKSMEGEIASSRKYYNGVVRKYNTMIQTIPSCFVASAMGLQKEPLFEISDESLRENVKVEF